MQGYLFPKTKDNKSLIMLLLGAGQFKIVWHDPMNIYINATIKEEIVIISFWKCF